MTDEDPVEHTATLHLVQPGGGGKVVFRLSDETTIGRSEQAGIQLQNDALVSRLHCRVFRSQNVWQFEDMNSRNGVLLNGRQAARGTLDHGDTLRIGAFDLHFSDVAANPPGADSSAGGPLSQDLRDTWTGTLAVQHLQGRRARYRLVTQKPFAYGRVSVMLAATGPDGQEVCIKMLSRIESRALPVEFVREVKAYEAMSHPCILPLIDYGDGTGDTDPFIVLPRCSGNLTDALGGRSFLPEDEALAILTRVASAVDYAHSRGVIHGDIKPSNILHRNKMAEVFLSDFGASRHFIVREWGATTAGAGPEGTTVYLSPEQLEHDRQSPKSDIYSFGMVAFELFTGSLPFDPMAPPFQQMKARVAGNLFHPTDVNASLSRPVADSLMLGLRVDPQRRPATAGEYCRLIKDALDGKPAAPASAAARAPVAGAETLPGEVRVFVTYSHKDAKYVEDESLLGYVSGLQSMGVKFWHDREIRAGDEWDDTIRREIESSHIALVLVSQAYLNSKYCQEVEIARFLQLRRTNGLIVLPIIVSPCDWKSHPWLAGTQFIPRRGGSLEAAGGSRARREKVFLAVLEELRAAVTRVKTRV